MTQSQNTVDQKLLEFINLIGDEKLRRQVLDIMSNPAIEIGGQVYRGLSLETSPAAKTRHHSYPGGLVQHMISVVTLGLAICDIVNVVYSSQVNRDIVVAATLIHDLMKPLTYLEIEDRYDISTLGQRIDHLSLAVAELIHRGFPLEVVHAVAAHHGKGSPIAPHTVEALICSLADSVDASLSGEIITAARWALRDCVGKEVERLSAVEAFSIVKARQSNGCKGVIEEFRKIKATDK